MKRVIVCGCRDWGIRAGELECDKTQAASEVSELISFLNKIHKSNPGITYVHGAAKGADTICHLWVNDMRSRGEKIQEEKHPADWKKDNGDTDYSAGPRRNEKMAKLGADLCVAAWDGLSRGTLNMITEAVAHGIPVRVVPRMKKKEREA